MCAVLKSIADLRARRTVSVRVPHLGTLTGLHVARRSERAVAPSRAWREQPLELSCDWIAAVRRHSDPGVVDALLHGPIAALLSDQHAPGFELRVEYGQVSVSRLSGDEDLIDVAERLADAVRRLCASPRSLAAFSRPLPPPRWLPSVRRHPEDGAINVPGEAFAVLRGRLPGTELTGRLLCCADRPLHSDPAGSAGCDVAALEVARATLPEGGVEGDLRVAIADGVLTAWRPRESRQADGPALDRLAADVATIVRRRGL
jgi:hypothetical protein